MERAFADRLKHLIDTVHPRGRGPFKQAEIVAAIRAKGHNLSTSYLSQLLTGKSDKPSFDVVHALADFFGVDPRYFSDPAYADKVDEQLNHIAWMRDSGLERIASRAYGLSPASQQALLDLAENLRRIEKLDEPLDPT